MANNIGLQQEDFSRIEENDYDNAPPIATAGQSLEANLDLGWLSTAVGNGYRWLRRQALEAQHAGEAPMSPQDLNKMYPDLDKPFEEPMNVYVAGEIAFQHNERKRLESVISAGPQSTSMKVAGFGMGMLAHALDPLEFGAGQLVGGVIQAGYLGSRLAAAAAPSAGIAAKAGLSVVEGGIANSFSEFADVASASEEHRDYGISDALTNIAVGTLGYTALATGVKLGLRTMKPAEVEVMHTSATGQLLNDRVVTAGDTLAANESKINHLETDSEFKVDNQVVQDAAQKSLSPEGKIDYSIEAKQILEKPLDHHTDHLEMFKKSNEETAPLVKEIESNTTFAPEEIDHISKLNDDIHIATEQESLWQKAFDCVTNG